MKCRAIVRIWNDTFDVIDRNDMQHARKLLCSAGIDRFDFAVRDRAAEQFGMQHTWKPHRVRVFGAAGDLVAPFNPQHRSPDL
jgi:hypothetical protein